VITNNGTLAFNRSNTITQGTDFGQRDQRQRLSDSGGERHAGAQRRQHLLRHDHRQRRHAPDRRQPNPRDGCRHRCQRRDARRFGDGRRNGHDSIGRDARPGNSAGIETFASGLTLSSGSTFNWELTGNTTSGRGTNFDGVNVLEGNLTIDTGLNFNIVVNFAGSLVNFDDPSFWSSN